MMFRDVIVGWDGTECARDALELAYTLREVDGTITAATIYPEPASTVRRAGPDQALPGGLVTRERAEAVADLAPTGAKAQSAWLEAVSVAGRSVAAGLRTLAAKRRAGLIVVGSSRHGRSGLVHAGVVGRALLADPPCRIAVPPRALRERARKPRVVAVAFDGSHQLAAVPEAAAVARSLGLTLRVYCLVPPLERWARDAGELSGYHWHDVAVNRNAHFHRLLDRATAQLPVAPTVTRQLQGRPLDQLLAEAARGADLLVIGARAGDALQHVAAGIAGGTLRAPSCPILTIPAPGATSRHHAVTPSPAPARARGGSSLRERTRRRAGNATRGIAQQKTLR